MSESPFQRPLRLAIVSRDTLSDRNSLCRRRAPIPVHWLELDWMFDLGPARAAVPSDCFVECDWGGARVFIGIGRGEHVKSIISDSLDGGWPRWLRR